MKPAGRAAGRGRRPYAAPGPTAPGRRSGWWGGLGGTVRCELVARMTAAQIQELRDTIAHW
jgi:hypothetical protein